MSMKPLPEGDNDVNHSPESTKTRGNQSSRKSGDLAENRWSLRVATVSGIPIRLHFTFFLVVIWFALADINQMGHVGMLLAILGLFFCVALHELGHSLVAQRLGYPVRDITLYPIGGVASIEGSPRPRHELLIAVAGPAVNIVIAVILHFILQITGDGRHNLNVHLLQGEPLAFLYRANVMLAAFNLLVPAFPMDGGRVLRATLGMFIGKYRATQIAAGIGQVIALLMGLTGLGVFGAQYQNFGLVIIGIFVFFAAAQERQIETTEEVISDQKVEAAMVRDFQTLSVGDTLRRATEQLLATNQQDFPVILGEEVQGVLTRNLLLRALATEDDSAYVTGVMERNVLFAHPEDPLDEYLLRADGVRHAPVLVKDSSGKLIGMVTSENAMEFLMIRQISKSRNASA